MRRPEIVRTAEIIGAAYLATDLGMGFPFEHGLQSTLSSCRPAERSESPPIAEPGFVTWGEFRI